MIQELPTEISGIFSEAGAMYIEAKIREAICRMPRPAKPYYFLALERKRERGSFRNCFAVALKAREEREVKEEEGEQKIDPLRAKFAEKQKRPKQWRKTWGDVLRIFREYTPLDDKSGWVPATAALDYLEQELVSGILFEQEWGRLLTISGVNPYWLEDLLRLGVIDLGKVKEPQMVVAQKIWSKIKGALDAGQSLKEAIEKLRIPGVA